MMFLFERLRGFIGEFKIINGFILALIIGLLFPTHYIVAMFVGLGYIFGNKIGGWGLWKGTLSVQRLNGYTLHDDGEGRNNGIEWLASIIIKPTQESWLNYCRVALAIRGFYWWLPTLAPLYFVGIPLDTLALMIGLLSIGFPIACELGYVVSKHFSFKFLELSSGWTWQECIYGLMQDLVLIVGIYYVMAN